MRILLDTHIFLWAVATPGQLSTVARKKIDAADVYISVASIWEISIKASLGKLDADPALLLSAITPAGFRLLPVTGDHAVGVMTLPHLHRDPFDRMLVAQATVEPMILVTNDEALRGYGAHVMVV